MPMRKALLTPPGTCREFSAMRAAERSKEQVACPSAVLRLGLVVAVDMWASRAKALAAKYASP